VALSLEDEPDLLNVDVLSEAEGDDLVKRGDEVKGVMIDRRLVWGSRPEEVRDAARQEG
jgi:hypothetical protein